MKVENDQKAIEVSCISPGCDRDHQLAVPEIDAETSRLVRCRSCGNSWSATVHNFSDTEKNIVSVCIYA